MQGIYYYHPDHLGSANWITDSDERPVEYLHYMPYGEPWQEQHRTTYDERYKFTGKERDAETEYDYFGARYYASALPMWLSVDPLSDKYPSISPYAYCNWNPITHIDPNGQWVETAWDVANVALDVQSFWTNIQAGNVGAAVVDGVALILDVGAAMIPGVPGTAGVVVKAARGADKVTNVATIATKYNYRQVLQKTTGKVGKGYDAHHTLPQKYRPQFEKAGINIDEPGNVVWRESKSHRANNHKHIQEWIKFFEDNKNPTREQILEQRKIIENSIWGNTSGDIPIK